MIKAKRFILKWNKEDITCNLVFERAPPSLLFFCFIIKAHFLRTNSFLFKPILSCNTWIVHLKTKWYFVKVFQVIKKIIYIFTVNSFFLCAMPKISLLMSTGKSQIHRHRCLNKIHRILSYIITTKTMQRKMHCFRQKWRNPEFGFVPTWNKNLKYQQLCDKIELQFSRNLPKVCRIAGNPGSLEGSLPQHRWWSGELNLPTPKKSHTSDAGKQWCHISLPNN